MELEIRENSEFGFNRSLRPFVNKLTDLIEETKIIFNQYQVKFLANRK